MDSMANRHVYNNKYSKELRCTYSTYMKNRGFTDKHSFDLFNGGCQTYKELFHDKIIEKNASVNNIVFWNYYDKPEKAEEQFMKYLEWILDSDAEEDEWKKELLPVLYPLFIHLYLDMLLKHNIKFDSSMVTVEEYYDYLCEFKYCAKGESKYSFNLLVLLPKIKAESDIEQYELMKYFRSNKVRIKITSATYQRMLFFLEDHSYTVLLTAFYKWFDWDISLETSVYEDTLGQTLTKMVTDEYSNFKCTFDPPSPTQPESAEVDKKYRKLNSCFEEKLHGLRDIAEKIRYFPPKPRPILSYCIKSEKNLTCAAVCRSFRLLGTGTLNGEIKLWNLQEHRLPYRVRHIPLGCDYDAVVHSGHEPHCVILRGHLGPVYDVKFLYKTDVALSVSHDTDMRAWNLSEYACGSIYKGHALPIWSVAVSKLGLHIATGSVDKTVRLWNFDRIFPVKVYAGHLQDVHCVRFHPNCAYVASASEDKTIRLWDITSGKSVRMFTGHKGPVHTLSFSPNGRYLASGGDGGVIKLWDLAAGKLFASFRGLENSKFIAVDWSKDRTTLSALYQNGVVWNWRVECLYTRGVTASHKLVDQVFKCDTGFSRGLALQYASKSVLVATGFNEVPLEENQPVFLCSHLERILPNRPDCVTDMNTQLL